MDKASKIKFVWFTVNRACELRCDWCYGFGSGFKAKDNMSLQFSLDFLEIVKNLGIKKIFLIGGEPSLWPHLFDFNDALRSNNIKSTIVSNSLRFSNDWFWEKYLEHPNTHIGASFKAFDSESLFDNTKSKEFMNITKGLKRIFEYQPHSIASFVYSKPYIANFLDMVKYAIDCGAFGVSVNFCSPAIHEDNTVDDRFMVDIDVLVNEIMSSYEQAHVITKGRLVFVMKHPICIWPQDFIQTLKNRGQISTTCHLQHQSGVIIDSSGSLLVCNSMFNFPIGSYGKDFDSADSLLNLFESKRVTDFFSQIRSYPSQKCINCEAFEDCGGGCPLLWTAHSPNDVIKGLSK